MNITINGLAGKIGDRLRQAANLDTPGNRRLAAIGFDLTQDDFE
jgi:hypothetical protein